MLEKEISLSSKLASERQRFLKFIVKRVGDQALAEDLLQESFLKCLNAKNLPEEEKIQAWFYQVIRNVVNDYYRRVKNKAEVPEDSSIEAPGMSPEALVESLQCACEMFFWSAVSPAQQKILKEVDLGGKPLKEFAAENNMTADAARVSRHRARKAMGKAILHMCECFDEGYENCPCPDSSTAL